ncbi:MAG TPA: asparaginase [Clostridia bacterium]|nr:asparaginase [Clostridia bacterium]
MVGFGDILVEVSRSGVVESRHYGSIAVVNRKGKLIASAGDPELVTFIRSAAKPIQAVPLVESGAADRFGFTPKELAVMTGSHSGEDIHTEAVRSILKKIGLDENSLLCGIHQPFSKEVQSSLALKGEKPGPVHNNCSGKHGAMLSLAVHLGYSIRNYTALEHPVQQIMLEEISYFTGVDKNRIRLGLDGCGVPVFGVSLLGMASAFSKLAWMDGLPEAKKEAVGRIVRAMQDYPEMVAGSDRLCTELFRNTGRKLVLKYGSEAVYCLGHLPSGVGIAIKVEDGSDRALGPVVIETLWKLGFLTYEELVKLRHFHRPQIRNHRGDPVGEVRPVVKLKKEI